LKKIANGKHATTDALAADLAGGTIRQLIRGFPALPISVLRNSGT